MTGERPARPVAGIVALVLLGVLATVAGLYVFLYGMLSGDGLGGSEAHERPAYAGAIVLAGLAAAALAAAVRPRRAVVLAAAATGAAAVGYAASQVRA